MKGRRIIYLCCLAGGLVFYFFYQQWMSWITLVTVLALPWVSLALSLPAIRQFRGELEAPVFVTAGEEAAAVLWGLSKLPQPLFLGRIMVKNNITGEAFRHDPRKKLPTEHCGSLRITAEKVRVCDYLGLFAFAVRNIPERTLIIRPRPVNLENPPDLSRYIARSWRPKFGGGYAENHELRLYRPGDSLNQVHWKLSAKTGELILREPMEPSRGLVLITMDLSGTPDEMDRKFGRLLTVSRHLLDGDLRHEIRVLTADGPVSCAVANDTELTKAVDRLLCCPAASEGSLLGAETGASWQFHIGGGVHET
ncbi:MAG: DUF58 domain-containing protein [Oscillospiraceae bacterium]|nr:DUF58 domain-containing protein [Oscillospiraceae bacterium]